MIFIVVNNAAKKKFLMENCKKMLWPFTTSVSTLLPQGLGSVVLNLLLVGGTLGIKQKLS
jgi:hypothetical protein